MGGVHSTSADLTHHAAAREHSGRIAKRLLTERRWRPRSLQGKCALVELTKPPVDAQLTLKVSFDENSGVLAVGYKASPVNLGATLAYGLNAAEATTPARALDAFAKRLTP